jgi:hypothetical protein
MNRKRIFLYTGLSVVFIAIWWVSRPESSEEQFRERAKVAVRDIGNRLLLSNVDSTSRVLPVIEKEVANYELSFEGVLAFDPNDLVSFTHKSIEKAALPQRYLVEVLQCSDGEVAYSYEMKHGTDNSIIPCRGRLLPENCYTIEIRFSQTAVTLNSAAQWPLYALGVLFLVLVVDVRYFNRKEAPAFDESDEDYQTVGSFQFYPLQHKLVKKAKEIPLSNKECELLALFVAHPNQILKRDELTKKVWEDNGVFVGRSLDTHISKLRKKLKEDDRVKLTNVHGVGYKLEVL